jgi:hypothetical protein
VLERPKRISRGAVGVGLNQDLENLAFAGRQLGNGSVAPVFTEPNRLENRLYLANVTARSKLDIRTLSAPAN